MLLQLIEHPAVSLAQGHGLDLPTQAARARATWMAGRQGRSPLLLVALLWARNCPDVVQVLDDHLDALFADFSCTPESWSESQAARQVLAAFNLQLFRSAREGEGVADLSAGLLLVQAGEAQFLQAGAIGLLRYQGGALQTLAGREGVPLGAQAELALVQHNLALNRGEALLLAPQPLLEVTDLQDFQRNCRELRSGQLCTLLEPFLMAPGAAVLLLPGAADNRPPPAPVEHWPAPAEGRSGDWLDGWQLLEACPYGPPRRVFRARDGSGREALLWLAETEADEAFWQREWVLRRSSVPSLPRVLSSHEPRRHAFQLFALAEPGMRSLADWMAAGGPLEPEKVHAVLLQLIEAVRVLQRRGMQGLWLSPRQILMNAQGRVLLLPEHAAILPGVGRQPIPPDAVPLAPELRNGRRADGRADQFALAALAYWLLSGQWPEVARPEQSLNGQYVPLARFNRRLPPGWDGVLARALAPQARVRFEALSEFQLALERPKPTAAVRPRRWSRRWRLALLAVLGLQLAFGLWLSLG